MSAEAGVLISKLAFGGSILLVIYIFYFEWRTAKANAEKAKIQLGEKENEDTVSALSESALIDLVNSDISPKSYSSGTKPTGPVSGSSSSNGDPKGSGDGSS